MSIQVLDADQLREWWIRTGVELERGMVFPSRVEADRIIQPRDVVVCLDDGAVFVGIRRFGDVRDPKTRLE